MARASAKRGRRPRANARAAAPVSPAEQAPAVEKPPKPPKPERAPEPQPARERRLGLRRRAPKPPPRPEDQMFFTRLRTHAKWVFVVLAAAFAIGFLAFGVGAGGTGFGDAIADFFGGDDAPTLEEAQAKVEENPRDAEALLELANVYEGRRDYAAAASTLERYLELRPDDVDVLRQLATVYGTRAQQIDAERSILTTYSGPESFQASVFAFPNLSGFIGAVGQDPISEAQARAVSQRAASLQDDIEAAYRNQAQVYERITKLTPDDPEAFLELGSAAAAAGENDKAIAAYERFLELDPESNQADSIREQIDLLKEDVRIVNG